MVKRESELKSGLLIEINFYVKNPTVLSFSLVRILYTVQYHVCKEFFCVYVCLCIKYFWTKTPVADNSDCLWGT